jgi:hypothetical protein
LSNTVAFELDEGKAAAFRRDGPAPVQDVFRRWVEPPWRGIGATIAEPRWRVRQYQPDGGPTGFFQDFCCWDRIREFRDFSFNSPAKLSLPGTTSVGGQLHRWGMVESNG